jgi:hypothetical protein
VKTAVLISGQLRTFKKCYPTQKWQIFRHYEPNIHFFASICNDSQTADIQTLARDYENVHWQALDDPTDLPNISTQQGAHAPYANAASHYKLMLQHWGNKKAWDFFASSAATESFDVIIRIRPDLWIHRFTPPRFIGQHIHPKSIVIGDVYGEDKRTVFAPWWGKFGGINDRLAIMGKEVSPVYFGLYDSIPSLLEKGCPFHPETLLAETLRQSGMNVQSNLMTEFSTDRMDGSRRWAEIQMSDVAELIASND